MGLQELLDSLKKNEQKQIDDIWQATKNEAGTLRQQVDEAITDITKNHAVQLDSACRKSRRSIFAETEIKAREQKLFTYQKLDQALLNTAVKLLPGLRNQRYETVFACLAAELPARQWEKVVVNPADMGLAARFFAADIVQPDPTISGGITATAAEGKITVANTFEKRLERKWLHILPKIIAVLEKRYEKTGSSEITA